MAFGGVRDSRESWDKKIPHRCRIVQEVDSYTQASARLTLSHGEQSQFGPV